jgi:hypothetical protein
MKVISTLFFVLVAVGLRSVGEGSDAKAPRFRFAPAEGLMNEPVSIEVSGLRPSSRVTVAAKMAMFGNWRSHATFIVDQNGQVRLDRDAPVEGTYTGADGMGLFSSMQPERPADGAPPPQTPDIRAPIFTTLDVEVEGRTIASATYKRWWVRPDVSISEVRADGLVGKFVEPQGTGSPHPAIIVLGGSEGGVDDYGAAGFAAKGYAALALAYFRSDSLPNELVNIQLEYFLKATDWLQRQTSVDRQRLAIFGKSRGAEAALSLASIAPQYEVVIACAPSSVSGPESASTMRTSLHGRTAGSPCPSPPTT